jgi:hypothetical protein
MALAYRYRGTSGTQCSSVVCSLRKAMQSADTRGDDGSDHGKEKTRLEGWSRRVI